jgi:hypothetical protein
MIPVSLWAHHGLHRGQCKTICGEIQIRDIILTDPREKPPCRLWIFLEKCDRLTVLGLCCPGMLDAQQIGREPGHILLPDVGPEGGGAPIRIEHEEEIVCAVDHRGQDGLHQEVRNGGKITFRFTFTEGLPSSSILGGPSQRRLACVF